MPDTSTLDDLTETHARFESAVRAWNFEAALVAWKRLDVLLERLSNAHQQAALAAVLKEPA